MSASDKIRVRVKGYDHTLVDAAAAKMLKRLREMARCLWTDSASHRKEVITILRLSISIRTPVSSSSREPTSA